MKSLRRAFLFLVLAAVLIAGGIFAGRLFPRHAAVPAAGEAAKADPAVLNAWRPAHTWLFKDPHFAAYRDNLVIPFARAQSLDAKSVGHKLGAVEISLPKGQPLHEYAYAFETWCAEHGMRILAGQESPESGQSGDWVEYKVKALNGGTDPLTVRLFLGKGVRGGTARLALVIADVGGGADAFKQWARFPFAATLILPDTSAVLTGKPHVPANRGVLLELPMEPSDYPFKKPGARALFIHQTAAEAKALLKARLKVYPQAQGFSTVLGDRAIQNEPLMGTILTFTHERGLLFVDLTGSQASLTTSMSLGSGLESFVAREQDAGPDAALEADLVRRVGLTGKTGEGVWVLRDAPGLPDRLAKLFARHTAEFGEAGLKWVTLREVRSEDSSSTEASP